MKFVLISLHYYPRISPRSNRTIELSKELARRGHDVIVYSLLGKYDYSLYEKEFGVKVKNLGYSTWGLMDSEEKVHPTLFKRIIRKYLGKWMWLPDREIISWVKSAIAREGDIDCLITIARPHVIHYAASLADTRKVKRWIADCGDPFTLNPLKNYPFYFSSYEHKWCRKCDFITVPFEGAKTGYFEQYHSKIRVIPQGFNFEEIVLKPYSQHKVPHFAYIGAVYNNGRNPEKFLQYLTTIQKPFEFHIYCSDGTWSFFKKYADVIPEKIKHMGRKPRLELLSDLAAYDFVINFQNDSSSQLPSKLIDYSLIKRPILNVSSEFLNSEKHSFEAFLEHNYSSQFIVENIDDYNIKNVANHFLELAK